MNKGMRFLILGAGRQGAAAAFDLARDGGRVVLADADPRAARSAAARVNRLVRGAGALARRVDVRDASGLARALEGFKACVCAVPYRFSLAVTRAALGARVSCCDLGGHTETVLKQLALDGQAKHAGLAVVPDCGLAPGTANVLAAFVLGRMRARGLAPRHVRIYCGGLPVRPRPPLEYQLLFSMEGLLNEYEGEALYLRKGRLARVPALGELETLRLPRPLGRCEAFVTSGGTSTCPYTYRGELETFEYKTLRYPGHAEKIRLLRDLGLFSPHPLAAGGVRVSPRQVFAAAASPKLDHPGTADLVFLRVEGRAGKRVLRADLLDFRDLPTGFTAMERTTGFSAAIVAGMLARGEVALGARTPERALCPERYFKELKRRGFRITLRWLEGTTDKHR